MYVQYPLFSSDDFSFDKHSRVFKARLECLSVDPVPYKEFIMVSRNTGKEVRFILFHPIYDDIQSAEQLAPGMHCGWRFVPSNEDLFRNSELEGVWVEIYR